MVHFKKITLRYHPVLHMHHPVVYQAVANADSRGDRPNHQHMPGSQCAADGWDHVVSQ